MEIMYTILAWALVWAIGAVILIILSRLGLGLTVDGFGSAFIASAVITLVSGVITWLLGLIGIGIGGPGLLGALVTLVVAAVVLMVSASFVRGMKINGFTGALIAAAGYSLIAWLFQWVIGLFV
jgi:putative membrane protein